MSKMAILVLGEQNGGKSNVWYALFGANVKTGKYVRPLDLGKGRSGHTLLVNGSPTVDVFIINSSPEESGKPVAQTLASVNADIVLCSVQYIQAATVTIDYFVKNDYDIKVVWLNPGFNDARRYLDCEGIAHYLMEREAELSLRSGADNYGIAAEIRQKILGWASYKL